MNKGEQVVIGFKELLNKTIYLNRIKMQNILKGYNPSEIHCIEYIANHKNSNVTKLAQSFYMTRSAISKIVKKLIEKNLVESYKKSENKKEIYFKLTKQGEKINKIHQNLHKEFQERDKIVFDQITEEQFNSILSFIEKYSKHLDKEINKLNIKSNKLIKSK